MLNAHYTHYKLIFLGNKLTRSSVRKYKTRNLSISVNRQVYTADIRNLLILFNFSLFISVNKTIDCCFTCNIIFDKTRIRFLV